MSKKLGENQVWIRVCNADEDDQLDCHVSTPNAWYDGLCERCPSSIRKRVDKDSDAALTYGKGDTSLDFF
jgi:hypothetical protein